MPGVRRVAFDESRADAPATTTEEEKRMSSNSDLRRRIDALEARVAECEADEGHALARIAEIEQREGVRRLETEVAGLRNSLGIRKEMHDEHKAELEALKRQCAMQEATLREIRSDLGGLYQNLELPSAVREMLASSRGIRDQWIAERDARIERLEAALQGYRSGRLHTFKPESDPA